MDPVLREAHALLARGEPIVLCTVVRSTGSTPRHVGSKMLVTAAGRTIGTVGGGDLEARVIKEAIKVLATGSPRSLEYRLEDTARGDPGICGGQVEVFLDPIGAGRTLIVIGAGHVGKAVAHLGRWLGFRIVVSDDRAEFCNPDNIPDADVYLICPMGDIPGQVQIDPRTSIVLTTRGTDVDTAGLAPLLASPANYIGVIGSRRRWLQTRKNLEAQGIGSSALDRVHSPIGLELEAETPEEIAVSIMAEVLMVRDNGTGISMKMSTRPASASQRGD